MVRTKADAARKAGGKASRKTPVLSGRSTSKVSKSGKKGHGSGNSYCKRPTPAWQVPINKIFKKSGESSTSADDSLQTEDVNISSSPINEPGTSGASSKSPQDTTFDSQSGDHSDMNSGSERDEMESDEEMMNSDEENNEDEAIDEEPSTNGDEKPLNGHSKTIDEKNEVEAVEEEPSTNGDGKPVNGHSKTIDEKNEVEAVEEEPSTNGEEKSLNGQTNDKSNKCKEPSDDIGDTEEPTENIPIVTDGDSVETNFESSSS